MAVIYFTQCSNEFRQDSLSEAAAAMPIICRIEYYKMLLSQFPENEFYSLDEHFILIAQWMKRKHKLYELSLVSICNCNPFRKEQLIRIDDEGDMIDDPQHGFFSQRLEFLR